MRSAPPPRRVGAALHRQLAQVLIGLLVVASLVALAAACQPGSGASGSPAASSGAPGGSGEPTPKPTVWPTLVVEGSIALGAADGDFAAMASDLGQAVESGEPAEILTVITRALEFLTENQANIPPLQEYPRTKDVGDRVAAAYAQMIEGATEIRDGLTSGDGDAVQTGFLKFIEGNTAYQGVRSELGDLAEQAIFMKRVLLR